MTRVDRAEVIERFCRISASVAELFGWKYAADCLCGKASLIALSDYRYDSEVLEFIEKAVADAVSHKEL